MALFVTFEMATEGHKKIWINAELVTSIRPGDHCTIIHFEKDHSLAVSDPIDRVMLQISTDPLKA
jgi:hypothetical protein